MSGYRWRLSPRLGAAGVGLRRPAAQSGQTLGPGTAADIDRMSIQPGQPPDRADSTGTGRE